MKTLVKSLALLTVLAFLFAPGLVRAQDDSDDQGASFQTFYDQLGDQGTWVQTDDYGYVFQPNVQDPNWAPYTDGNWAYTDQGWTWVSDEPWGWATYHYGRWANIDGLGWIWVPGYRWAPAWVSWRYGGGYCGWAPLPPESFVGAEYGGPGIGVGFHFGGDVDVNFHIGAGCYNFVRVGDLGEPNYRGHYVNRENNFAIINHTKNITNINVSRTGARGFNGVSVGGPSITEVNAHSHQPIQTVHLTSAYQPGKSTVQGNSLAVFAPKVSPASASQAKPARVGQTISHPTFNRGDSIMRPLAVTASIKPAAPSPAAIQAAETAQRSAPASARIATEKTPIKTALTKPLTSMAPVSQAARTPSSEENGANTVTPHVDHNAGNAPFTGESSVKPAVEHHDEVKSPDDAGSNQEHKTEVDKEVSHEPQAPAQPKPQTQAPKPPPQGSSGGQGGNKPGGGSDDKKSDGNK